jgi:ubiquinone/menaquinone biosynthesis C-methylase UbiE
MSLYERWILPRLTHLSMRQKQLAAYRARALAGARGRVLEIGIGSGLNLPFYGHGVERVLGVDPSPELIRLAERGASKTSFPVEFLVQSAEEMPLQKDSIDTAVTAWTLCTIPDAVRALREVRRVLKRDGLLIFVEHGRAPEPKVVAWQNRLTPLWERCAGGCHLNRKIDDLVRAGGFNIAELQTGYAKGPRPMAFMYEGRATPS